MESGYREDETVQGVWGWRCGVKFFQGCLNGFLLAISLCGLIILVIWLLARCEMVEKNLLTRLVGLLLNRIRTWWYVDQVNSKDLSQRRAEFIGSIRMKNLIEGRR